MTYVLPDPRTQAFARITASDCLLLCNSDLAWSVAAATTYATARGVPLGNIVSLPFGTTQTWDPGSNSAIADFCTTLKAARVEKGARAILIGAGCPIRVVVRGVSISSSTYNPAATGLPAFGHLVMGSPSYSEIITGDRFVTCRELGSGNWRWFAAGGPEYPFEIWNARVAWKLGITNERNLVDSEYEKINLIAIDGGPSGAGTGSLPTPLATSYAGWSGARVIPAGRIGWGAWRTPSSAFLETPDNWDGPLNSALASNSLTSQPEPIIFSLYNGTSSMELWAAMAKATTDWGYDVEYFYRQTNIPAAVEALCPVAGAVWSKADFEGGSIVGAPYYVLAGDFTNADDPVRTEPFRSAFAPVNGSDVVETGPSYSFEYGIRALQTGAASAVMDVTHRTSGETKNAWSSLWYRLRGMNSLEWQWNNTGSAFYSGDPLHRPFHFDPADSIPPIEPIEPPPPPISPPDPPPRDDTPSYNLKSGNWRSPRFSRYRTNPRR